MRSVLRLVIFFAIVFCFRPLRAQPGDPSQMFLNAYMAVQQGEKLEQNGKETEALSKFRYAASLLDQISSQYSDWQPLIVNYRKRKTHEMIQSLEDSVALEGPDRNETLEPILEGPVSIHKASPTAPNVDIGGRSSSNIDSLELVTQRIRDRMRKLETQVSEQRKQIDDLQRDKQELLTRLSDSMQQVEKAHTDEAEVRAQLVQTKTALDNALSDAAAGTEVRAALKERVLMLTEALQQARDESAVADEFTRDFQQQIKRFQKAADEKIATIANERDEVIASREAALASRDEALAARGDALDALKKSKTAQEQVETLKNENEALLARLEKAELTIKNFDAEQPRKDEEITQLRQQVGAAKEVLARAQEEGKGYQSSIADLREQLDSANQTLAELRKSGTATSEEMTELSRENELLRSIVLRELKEQARRDQAKKLVLAELAHLEGKSEALMNQIEYLGQPLVLLTDKERTLFKDSQIDLPEIEESGAMEISIAAPKPEAQKTPSPEISGTEMASVDIVESPPGSEPSTTESESTASPHVETAHSPNVPAELLAQAKEARELFDRSKYREAEEIYEKMQAEAPNNVYILSNLGVVRFRSGKLRLAEEAFQKALAIDPRDSFSRCTLGIVFYQQGKYDQAIDELTQALAVDPKNATAHNYLGITASQKGWAEAAQKEMETAIQLDPNYADAYFNLAVIHATWQPPDRDEAKRYYQKALSLGAQPDSALENLLK